ncbi:MAG: hypothetical protein ACI4QF_02090 [Kiritimatiellia bacterium]
MSEGPCARVCRWLLVSALASFCLWKGAGTASAYLESAGAGSYTDCWREAARNAPGHRIALLCKDASNLSPMDRARLAAISWERVPEASVTVDRDSDLRPFDTVLSFAWLAAADERKLKDDGFVLVASNRHAKTWSREGVSPSVGTPPSAAPSAVRECLALSVEFALLLLCLRMLAGRAPLGLTLSSVATALVVAAVLGCIALSHTLLEPNGLGTYGGKAKLLFSCEGLPRDYFTTVAGNALQPSYPPGMTLLAYFHFLLSGGCGDRLVQLLEAFAMGLVGIGLLRGGSGPRAAVPVVLYLLSPMAIRTTSGFYAEPFAALMLLVGWNRLVRGEVVRGALILGLSGMFRPEAGVVAVAFALAGCWGQGVRRSLTSAAVAALPAFAWMMTAWLLGYGGVQDWDFLSVPRFGQMAYALLCEARFLGVTAVPVALVLYLVRPLHRPCIDRPARRALLAAAALMLIVPILCGFHASSHAAWMMDNTVPRFAWYVLVVPLGALARCAVTQRS